MYAIHPQDRGRALQVYYAVFRFTLNTDGHSELHYKNSSDIPWQPEEDGIRLISV